jgi:hypothetical protein
MHTIYTMEVEVKLQRCDVMRIADAIRKRKRNMFDPDLAQGKVHVSPPLCELNKQIERETRLRRLFRYPEIRVPWPVAAVKSRAYSSPRVSSTPSRKCCPVPKLFLCETSAKLHDGLWLSHGGRVRERAIGKINIGEGGLAHRL